MEKILISNGKALVDNTGKVLTFESDVTITRDNESIGLSGEYDGSPIEITEAGKVNIKALIDEKKIPLEVNVNVASSVGETYKGEYQVVPSVLEQTLETKNKYLIDNVIVSQIPYYTVSNEGGGNTVTIGETPTDKNGETILLSL